MEKTMQGGELWVLPVSSQGVLASLSGRFWLTRKDDRVDYFLCPGELMSLPRGRWLIQAFEPGSLSWTPACSVPSKWLVQASAELPSLALQPQSR